MKTRVLLIDPPFYRILGFYNRYFPVSVTQIATTLQRYGHDAVVYDADCNKAPQYMDYASLPQHYPQYLSSLQDQTHTVWEEVKDVIGQIEARVVGISVWTTYAAAAFHTARLCKEVNPACTVVMGGPHATAKAKEILDICPYVDYVITGEGETAMLQLIESDLAEGNALENIPGLSFRNSEAVVHNPVICAAPLTELPTPDRSLLMNEDTYSPEDMGLIMSSRGCPFACAYCATHTRYVSYTPVDRVLEEIRHVRQKYGTTFFSFKDDSFTVNKKRVAEFCDRLIGEHLAIQWECNTRVDLITEDLLRRMKKAGCRSIKVGIESGSDRILSKMNKGISREQVRSAARILKRVGIFWTGYFMMGVPGETVDEIRQTLDFMHEIKPDFASISVYEPFPGTPMFEEGVARGLVKPQMTMEDFYTMLPNDYYKADPHRQVESIGPDEFHALARDVKSEFHAYNKSLAKTVKRASSRLGLYINRPRTLLADINRYRKWR